MKLDRGRLLCGAVTCRATPLMISQRTNELLCGLAQYD